jgi:hypothetical protein
MLRRPIFVAPEWTPAKISNQVRFPWSIAATLALWILLAEAGVQVWYGLQRQSTATAARWTIDWPTSENGYKTVTVPKDAENLLRYNEGGAGTWHGADGRGWMMYFFRWFPGRTAALFVKVHRPDVCLPASGMTMSQDSGLRLLEVNNVSLPIRSYRFDDRGRPLHVFYCYSDGRSSYANAKAAEQEDWSARGRVRAAWQGRRDVGAQMLEVVVWGYDDDRAADEALKRQLARIIHLG